MNNRKLKKPPLPPQLLLKKQGKNKSDNKNSKNKKYLHNTKILKVAKNPSAIVKSTHHLKEVAS